MGALNPRQSTTARKEPTPMKTMTPTSPVAFETCFATTPNTPSSVFTPCPLRDTLAILLSVAGLGGLVKIVLFILAIVVGY
jgi:hypothetical protein